MALLANFVLFGSGLAALMVAFLFGFHGGFTAGLLFVSRAEVRDAHEGECAGYKG